MGIVTMLSLSGPIIQINGYADDSEPVVVRTFSDEQEISDAKYDALLVHQATAADRLSSTSARSIVFVGEPDSKQLAHLKTFDSAVILDNRFNYLADGDIVGLRPSAKRIRSLYRRNSRHNSFLVTERCNHYCLMCSQPPRNVDDGWLLDEIDMAIRLVDKSAHEIGFTGGEPLLDWQRFIELVALTKEELPHTEIHVLSNGRAFSRPEVTKRWSEVDHKKLMVGIPLYAAVDTVHDYVVQAQNAFEETVLGILRLKNAGQRVEIRVVLHAITAPHVVDTCRWIARNIPFVDHVALMGMENTGFALANEAQLWIDPVDYKYDLARGVELLNSAGVQVSVYNVPLCLLEKSVWDFAVQSISDWKNAYLPQCEDCAVRRKCGGFFTTGRPKYSASVRAIENAHA
jgi:His-Xaa-Ser system radical SAM maturase HxsC